MQQLVNVLTIITSLIVIYEFVIKKNLIDTSITKILVFLRKP